MAAPLKVPPKHPSEILLLTLVAGSADALGYLSLGKVFTSNMTGNVVLMGIALAEGRGSDTGHSLFAFLAFIVGNGLGAFLCGRFSRKDSPSSIITTVIGLEAMLLLAFAAISVPLTVERQLELTYPLIALLGASMGLQAAAIYRMSAPGVTTTAITGTLTTLLAGLTKPISFLPKFAPVGTRSYSHLRFAGPGDRPPIVEARPSADYFACMPPDWAGFFPAAMVVIVVLARLARRD